MGSINIVTTILNMSSGHDSNENAAFVWTWLITACLLIAVMPTLAGAITMILTDRHFGTAFLMQLEVVTSNVPTYILVLWAP